MRWNKAKKKNIWRELECGWARLSFSSSLISTIKSLIFSPNATLIFYLILLYEMKKWMKWRDKKKVLIVVFFVLLFLPIPLEIHLLLLSAFMRISSKIPLRVISLSTQFVKCLLFTIRSQNERIFLRFFLSFCQFSLDWKIYFSTKKTRTFQHFHDDISRWKKQKWREK